MENFELTDAATGAVMRGEYDPSDPYSFFSPAGRAAENAGAEASVEGWKESRYFSDRESYDAFKASGKSLEDYFNDPAWNDTPAGKAWAAGNHEELIYQAGQRIEKTYQGNPYGTDGEALTYPTAIGRARLEAEKRLGKPVGGTY
jgi:hypothetical protein